MMNQIGGFARLEMSTIQLPCKVIFEFLYYAFTQHFLVKHPNKGDPKQLFKETTGNRLMTGSRLNI